MSRYWYGKEDLQGSQALNLAGNQRLAVLQSEGGHLALAEEGEDWRSGSN